MSRAYYYIRLSGHETRQLPHVPVSPTYVSCPPGRRQKGETNQTPSTSGEYFHASCFQDVDFFMLPSPSSEVTVPEYDRTVASVDSKFMELATMLFEELVDPTNLAPKTIRGSSLTCDELFTYAKICAALLQNASRLPDLAIAFAGSTTTETTEALKANALKFYEEEMDEFCEPGIKWVRSKKLKTQHEECKRRALEVFTDKAGIVSEHIQAAQEEINVEIEAKFSESKKRIKKCNFKSFTKVLTIVLGGSRWRSRPLPNCSSDDLKHQVGVGRKTTIEDYTI